MSEQHRDVRFYFVDVFAKRPLEGNPLAVVPDADHLDAPTMQRIAREFNQSETTFLLRPERSADFRLRSFTPAGVEVFGAGHNALGAWWWIAESGFFQMKNGRRQLQQQIGERVLPLEISFFEGRPVHVIMQHDPPELRGRRSDLGALAVALGIDRADFVDDLPVQVVATGVAHLLVPIRSRDAIDSLHPDSQKLASVLRDAGAQGCYAFSLDPRNPGAMAYARFFNPTAGIPEDPATGSAAGPLGFYLRTHNVIKNDGNYTIEQGQAVGRPSEIGVSVSAGRISVFGTAVVSAEGRLMLS